jgi:hypothetical protein
MWRAVWFYQALGFPLRYGGEDADFTSFTVGEGELTLDECARSPARSSRIMP